MSDKTKGKLYEMLRGWQIEIGTVNNGKIIWESEAQLALDTAKRDYTRMTHAIRSTRTNNQAEAFLNEKRVEWFEKWIDSGAP